MRERTLQTAAHSIHRGVAVRIAVAGAGAIGAYWGAATAARGCGSAPDRAQRAPAGDARERCAGAQPAGRLRGLTRTPPTTPRDRPRRLRLPRAQGAQLPVRAARWGSRCWASTPRCWLAQNGIPWWYFHATGGALRGAPHRGRRSRRCHERRGARPNGRSAAWAIPPRPSRRRGVIRHLEGTRFSIGEPSREISPRCQSVERRDDCRRIEGAPSRPTCATTSGSS